MEEGGRHIGKEHTGGGDGKGNRATSSAVRECLEKGSCSPEEEGQFSTVVVVRKIERVEWSAEAATINLSKRA